MPSVGGLDLNHGRGGDMPRAATSPETVAHSNGTSAQDGDGMRQVLDFAQQVAFVSRMAALSSVRERIRVRTVKAIRVEPVGRLIQQSRKGGNRVVHRRYVGASSCRGKLPGRAALPHR